MKYVVFIYLIILQMVCDAQIISTICGTGIHGNTGNYGLAIDAEIISPDPGAFDKYGN